MLGEVDEEEKEEDTEEGAGEAGEEGEAIEGNKAVETEADDDESCGFAWSSLHRLCHFFASS